MNETVSELVARLSTAQALTLRTIAAAAQQDTDPGRLDGRYCRTLARMGLLVYRAGQREGVPVAEPVPTELGLAVLAALQQTGREAAPPPAPPGTQLPLFGGK